MADHSLNGKVVLIGGGAKNLGGLISRELAKGGAAAVVVHYNSDATRGAAEETVAAVQTAGAKAIAVQGDLTQPKNVTRLFDEALSQFGKIDVAVNTTGMVIKKPIVEVTEHNFRYQSRRQWGLRNTMVVANLSFGRGPCRQPIAELNAEFTIQAESAKEMA